LYAIAKMQITKINIALIQLRTAVQLYNKNNFIAAITLAGAAEEILGQIASQKIGSNAALEDKTWTDQIADYFDKPRLSFGKVIKSRNKIKNKLKHNDSGENEAINHDFRFESETFILGAIRNYELLTGEMPKDRIIKSFWNWVSM
jgi:hypothetical protein